MDSPAAMPTADESNHSAATTLHPHHTDGHMTMAQCTRQTSRHTDTQTHRLTDPQTHRRSRQQNLYQYPLMLYCLYSDAANNDQIHLKKAV